MGDGLSIQFELEPGGKWLAWWSTWPNSRGRGETPQAAVSALLECFSELWGGLVSEARAREERPG